MNGSESNSTDFVDLRWIARRLGCSVRTAQRYVVRSDFPQKFTFSTRNVRWRASEIEAWVSAQRATVGQGA